MSNLPEIEIGKFNRLEVLKLTEQGFYLGDAVEEILLPNKYTPEGLKIGDFLDVFIYTDSEDRMIATTLKPKIQSGEFAIMKVKDVTSFGAFMDWGLEKDLLVPFKEQSTRMEVGQEYLIHMYLDNVTDRLVGSSHLAKFTKNQELDLNEGDEVNLFIGDLTDLGYRVIINDSYQGLLFKNEVFKSVKPGEHTIGYIKKIREDKKVDVSLEKVTVERFDDHADQILDELKKNEGFMALHDKSSPEEIYDLLQMSKKNFKKAVGKLYKKRLIKITDKGIAII